MDSTPTAERGFTLLEVLVCVGVLVLAGAAGAGAFAAVARQATPGTTRDLALMVGENALARARAAIAYASSASADGTTLLSDRSWGLVPGETEVVAGGQLRASAMCGVATPLVVRLPIAATYDTTTQRFTVVVTYPVDPCALASDGSIPTADAATLTLGETLPPSAFPPGQVLTRQVATPARM
jgi:prepilin-type N-terminal cleavage/methylation domain-containing protein